MSTLAKGLNIVAPKTYTLQELQELFPSKRKTINEGTVKLLNETLANPDFNPSTFIKHIVDYQNVMINSGASMKEYLNAVKFCAYLESEMSIVEAYRRARAGDKFVQDRINAKSDTTAYAELAFQAQRYKKSKLVRELLTQTDMPLYLMFQASRYKAVATLAREMEEAPLSKDRIAAADKLLTHVKPPETQNVELQVGMTNQAIEMQEQLFAQISKISQAQSDRLKAGENLDDVQQLGLTADFIEAETNE